MPGILDGLIWAALGLFFVGVSVGIAIGLELASSMDSRIQKLIKRSED